MTAPALRRDRSASGLDWLPPVWAQASTIAALWIVVAAIGGFGDNLSPEGAAAAAGLALVAANTAIDIPRSLRAGVALALLVAGAATGVLATGPSLSGDAATGAYVVGTLLALAAATAPRQAASLALVPAVAIAARAAPGVNTVLGLGVAAIAVAVAVVLLVTSAEERPHRDAPWGAPLIAVGLAALTFPLLDSAATLLIAAGVLAVASHHPLALLAALPGAAVATELLLVENVPGRERALGVIGAVALVLSAYAAARELGSRSPATRIAPGVWPSAVVGIWLLLAPQTWGWASRTVPTVLVLDGYVAGATRATAAGLVAVAVAGVIRLSMPARRSAVPRGASPDPPR